MVAPRVSAVELDLTAGDPLDRLERRLRLKVGAPAVPVRPIVMILTITVLPLAVLAGLHGQLGALIRDPLVIGRLLIALPLLQLAGPPVARSLTRALEQCAATGLVAPEDWPLFETTVGAAVRMRDSHLALTLILAAAFGVAVLGGRGVTLSYVGDWSRAGGGLSLAGWWYVVVSLATLHFVRLRWLWRMLVWWRFLFGLSRLPLRLMPAHPDRAGGLGFLSNVATSFALLVFALCVAFGFDFRALIMRGAATLETLTGPMVGLPALMLVWMLAPLAFFLPQLKAAKRRGKAEYGRLAARYTRQFDARWLDPGDGSAGELLGTSDIQSLADLANSCDVVGQMRLIPLTKHTAVTLVLTAGAAMLPAVVAQIPLKEILLKVLSALH